MKGILVINPFRLLEANKYKIKRFKDEFKKYDVELDVLDTIQLGLCIKNGCFYSALDLTKYAFAIMLDKDESCAYMLEHFLPVFNSAKALELCNDKFKTFSYLANHGINLPTSLTNPLCYNETYSEEAFSNFLDRVETELGYPLICKNCYGSMGLKVYLIKNRDELQAKFKELIHVPHLYQRFVSNSCGRDYRLFTIGGKVVSYMLRVNQSDFRSNIALGGKGYHTLPPSSFIEMAERISKLLNIDFAGIDLMIDVDDKPVLAEVNSNAFLTEIEAVSHDNIADLIAQHILNKIHK